MTTVLPSRTKGPETVSFGQVFNLCKIWPVTLATVIRPQGLMSDPKRSRSQTGHEEDHWPSTWPGMRAQPQEGQSVLNSDEATQ